MKDYSNEVNKLEMALNNNIPNSVNTLVDMLRDFGLPPISDDVMGFIGHHIEDFNKTICQELIQYYFARNKLKNL